MAQRLDKGMKSKISLCISSCRVVHGGWGGGEGSPGEILKTKTAGEAISDHFAMQIKVSNLPELCLQCIVLEAGHARSVSRRSRVRSSCPAHYFVQIWS